MKFGPIGIRYIHRFVFAVALLPLLANIATAQSDTQNDSDHDGLTDTLEQSLLEQFRPTFMISATDCAVRPARFEPDVAQPKPVANDGTIYGQVFPVSGSSNIEIHYYTLWNKDCGRNGHALDAEHVSAIVSITPGTEPKALYWYAGAHEGTVCDISSGARAEALGAEEHGPRVWSSAGKHALFLRKAMCGHGCGADSCGDDVELLNNSEVINLGEPTSPANGSTWLTSTGWALPSKMDSDFPPEVVARIDATSGEMVVTLRGNSSLRGTIQGSGAVLDGAATGAQHTGAALDTADVHTSRSLGKATRATGRSLRRAWNAIFGRQKPKSNK